MEGIRESEKWTDEKHSMYIKSIETSFVNDLYDSKQTTKPNHSSTSQFKVLRGGCWQKMNFERENSFSQMSRVNNNQRQDLIANPWIQHYIKHEGPSSTATQINVTLSQRKKKSQLYHQNMISSDTEVSDQNFVDEEVKVEKEKTSNPKRRKSLDF